MLAKLGIWCYMQLNLLYTTSRKHYQSTHKLHQYLSPKIFFPEVTPKFIKLNKTCFYVFYQLCNRLYTENVFQIIIIIFVQSDTLHNKNAQEILDNVSAN